MAGNQMRSPEFLKPNPVPAKEAWGATCFNPNLTQAEEAWGLR